MQLIQTLAGQIGGEFTLASSGAGARFQLVFPASA
jgi:two-component sensor histidine kinase